MSSTASSLIASEAINFANIDNSIECERAEVEKLSVLADLPIEILSHILSFSSIQDVENLSMICKCSYALLEDQRKKLKQFNAEIKPHFPDWIVNIFNHWTDLLDLKKVKFEKTFSHEFSIDDFKDPITIAIDKMNRRFIAIKFIEKKLDGSLKNVRLFFLDKVIGKYSKNITLPIAFCHIKFGAIIKIDNTWETNDGHFNYIKRLVNRENVGVLDFVGLFRLRCCENNKRTITDGSSAAEIIKV